MNAVCAHLRFAFFLKKKEKHATDTEASLVSSHCAAHLLGIPLPRVRTADQVLHACARNAKHGPFTVSTNALPPLAFC